MIVIMIVVVIMILIRMCIMNTYDYENDASQKRSLLHRQIVALHRCPFRSTSLSFNGFSMVIS